ncbi:MAG: translation elongation factor Ts [Candidatus Peribacteraceae bacterium]|nr:translation elongation factor Ts [Candidatus Peribacteraceae bacterium]
MTNITAAAVQQLRARTGVGIVAVKQALEDAAGNEEKAIELLRKRGLSQAVKKADREQTEGAIFIGEAPGKAALIVLKCETDFVGRSDAFIALGQELANSLAKDGAAKAKALADSKLPEAVQKLGENIGLGETLEVNAAVMASYVHSNRKIGVIIGMESGDVAKAKDVAMHAAAMNPLYVLPEDVPADAVAKEKEIWKEQMKNEKKPPEILEKIMFGKERKFREENALMKQPFVKDSAMTVEKFLGGAKVTVYQRVAI